MLSNLEGQECLQMLSWVTKELFCEVNIIENFKWSDLNIPENDEQEYDRHIDI